LITVFPSDAFEKLEFNKILNLVSEGCQGEKGRYAILHTMPSTDKEEIVSWHEEVDEWKKAIERASIIPFSQYGNIEEDIYLLEKEGYVLEIEALQRIQVIVSLAHQVKNYFQDYTLHKIMPHLSKIGLEFNVDGKLGKEIERILDEEGNVRPNASDALSKISKSIHNKEREVYKVFRQEVLSYRDKGYLVEGHESIRNSRPVLMVAAEHKRRIPGVIHDESSTGKTVFIEPASTMMLNNEVHNLYAERRAEIYRILKDLCTFLRPYGGDILNASEIIVRLDVIRAKAIFALKVKGSKPNITGKPTFGFKEAFNPLLFIRLNAINQSVVPFDFEAYNQNKFLILSGPNAGGKSVTLKSVGLLQLMMQSGMLVCANENSKFGIFTKMFVDIGDQQSIDDDLSTYSSHLTNMKTIIDQADEKSLILIDEFGSGTDPKIGGAIAEALLKQMQASKSYGVVTTHYSNLKFFAFKNFGFLNGCMEFDKNALKPTYQLIVGKPGSSFAFEIAQKIGLPEEVITYAKKQAGKHERSIEEMLVNLQAERQEYEKKMSSTVEKEERLDRLMKNYEQLYGDLEYKRKKLKLDQKEASIYKTSEIQKELQKMLKELKDKENIAAVEKKIEETKQKSTEVKLEINIIKEELHQQTKGQSTEIKVGGYAQVRNGDSIGKVISIDKEMAEVELGFFTLKIPLKDLISTTKPIEKRATKSVMVETIEKSGPFDTKLDLRGYRVEEAMTFLQEFLEKAILYNAHELRIIHGVGNGILKRKVHAKFKEYKDIKEYWHPEENLGGEGVTYVKF
jgi:DNA mismatch repair protein MutS2